MREVEPKQSFDVWRGGFSHRFPWQVADGADQRELILRLLYELDTAVPLQVSRSADGVPVFRFKQVAEALGIQPKSLMKGARASGQVTAHIRFEKFDGKEAPCLTLAGLVALVAAIGLTRFRSLRLQRRHHVRQSLALEIVRALPCR